MNKKTIILMILVLAGVFAAGFFVYRNNKREPAKNTVEAKEVYYCPMHKEYVSDKPGNCPICSMKLVKKEGSDEDAMKTMIEQSEGTKPAITPAPDGGVFTPPQKQQVLGVRSVPAETKLL